MRKSRTFFLVRIAIQNPSGTLAFGGHLLSPTTSEAKWKGNRLLSFGRSFEVIAELRLRFQVLKNGFPFLLPTPYHLQYKRCNSMTDTCNMPPNRAVKWVAMHLTKAWKYPCQDGIMVSITCKWSDPCPSCNHYIHHEYSLMTNDIFKRRQLTFNPVPQEYTTYDQTLSQTTETIVFNLSTTN